MGRAQDEEAFLTVEPNPDPGLQAPPLQQESPAQRAPDHLRISDHRDQAPPPSEELKGDCRQRDCVESRVRPYPSRPKSGLEEKSFDSSICCPRGSTLKSQHSS